MAKLRASIQLETNRTELFEQRASNERMVSEADGDAAGLRLAASADVPRRVCRVTLRNHSTYPPKADPTHPLHI